MSTNDDRTKMSTNGDYERPPLSLSHAPAPPAKARVSGSKFTGYWVMDADTGDYLAGPFRHWGEAFVASGRAA